jgi:hypothetical protein
MVIKKPFITQSMFGKFDRSSVSVIIRMKHNRPSMTYYLIINIGANGMIGVAGVYGLIKLFGVSACELQNYKISRIGDHEHPLFLENECFAKSLF